MRSETRTKQETAKEAARRRKEELLAEVRAEHPEISERQLRAEYKLLEIMGLD